MLSADSETATPLLAASSLFAAATLRSEGRLWPGTKHPEEGCLSRQEPKPRVVAGKKWQCLKLNFNPVDAIACETASLYDLGATQKGTANLR